jgi:hypothetical protein
VRVCGLSRRLRSVDPVYVLTREGSEVI